MTSCWKQKINFLSMKLECDDVEYTNICQLDELCDPYKVIFGGFGSTNRKVNALTGSIHSKSFQEPHWLVR